MSLRQKVLAFDFSAWNRPRRAKRIAPLVAGVGAFLGTTVYYFWVDHLVSSPAVEDVLSILIPVGAIFGAFALLALFD